MFLLWETLLNIFLLVLRPECDTISDRIDNEAFYTFNYIITNNMLLQNGGAESQHQL